MANIKDLKTITDPVERMIQKQIRLTQDFIDELELRKSNNEKFADEDKWELTDNHILNNQMHIDKLENNLKEYQEENNC
jgi:CCR4-NOT transcriptional regulation complex NOT5 subunit